MKKVLQPKHVKRIIGQSPLFAPDAGVWSLPRMSDLPSWAGVARIGLDTETNDPLLMKLGPGVRRGAKVVGIAFSFEDGGDWYLPIGHSEDNLDAAQVWRYLIDQSKVFTGEIVGANLQYDLDFLAENGVVFRRAKAFLDIQVADALINELHDSYSLAAVGDRWGIQTKNEDLLKQAADAWGVHHKHGLWELPARYVIDYASLDSRGPLTVLRLQEVEIEKQGLQGIWELESRVLPVLVKMRRRGVLIDQAKLQEVEDFSIQEERDSLKLIYDQTGVCIDLGDVYRTGPLAMALETIGVMVPKTKTGKPSVKAAMLEQIDHPVADKIRWARKVNKLRSTFVSQVREHMVNGRVHCTFNQMRRTKDENDSTGDEKGTRYGRLSSSDFNVQQQPSRDSFAQLWRSIYIPDGDGLWGCCDYSQQEPRMLTHFAELVGCEGAEKMGTKYRTDPTADNHTLMSRIVYGLDDTKEPTKEQRSAAKIIYLGLCYSMGGGKLAHSLGLPTKWIKHRKSGEWYEVAGSEAQSILDQFNRRAPFVRQLADMCKNKANERGYIKTILGRHCRFPRDESGFGYDWTHKALNRLIQGSSADQTKLAIVEADAAGFDVQLQVHDEIDQTFESPAHADQMGELMRTCLKLQVPSKVDVELGRNWGYVYTMKDWHDKRSKGDERAKAFLASLSAA